MKRCSNCRLLGHTKLNCYNYWQKRKQKKLSKQAEKAIIEFVKSNQQILEMAGKTGLFTWEEYNHRLAIIIRNLILNCGAYVEKP